MKKTYTLTLLFALIYNLSISQNTFPATGSVGIGTSTPQQKLHVEGNLYINNGSFLINQTASSNAKLYFSKLGTYMWDIGTEVSDPTNNFILFNRANSTYPVSISTANVPTFKTDRIRLEGLATGGGNLWDIKCRDIVDDDFGFYNVRASAYRFYINNLGNVSIGTTTPGSYKLAVAGKIAATGEVRVFTDGTTSFPDYVFEPSYKLPLLEETEAFIKENHHLPEVPSAAEIAKEGMSLNEMNVILLKKVEELTLYMIELKKENTEMKKESQEMKKEIEVLKKSHQK